MVRSRFTEEQIADFLQQSKTAYRIRRCAKNMDLATARSVAGRRNMLKAYARIKTDRIYREDSLLCFIVAAILLTLMFPKPTAALAIPPYLVYCISYIRRFRRISAKHIRRWDISSSRSGSGAENVFYKLSWTFLFLCLHIAFYSCLNKP